MTRNIGVVLATPMFRTPGTGSPWRLLCRQGCRGGVLAVRSRGITAVRSGTGTVIPSCRAPGT